VVDCRRRTPLHVLLSPWLLQATGDAIPQETNIHEWRWGYPMVGFARARRKSTYNKRAVESRVREASHAIHRGADLRVRR
jgi:hypothetical protein